MFKKTTSKNGLRIITVPMRSTKSVTVLILVGAGTKYEKKEENGISHFLEHMYFKGTKKRPNPLDISKEIDGVGGAFNAFTSKDWTGYFVKVDFSHFNLALDLVSDIFLHSTLRKEELEKERGVILEEIKMIKDTPMHYIEDLWERLLYKDQPAGWDIVGRKEIVSKIQRDNLVKYLDTHYSARNTVIGIAGKINSKEAPGLVKRYFSDIKEEEPKRKAKVKEEQKEPEKLFFKKDTEQTHLAVGVRTFNIFDKRRYALSVLGTLLGGNMSSRLFQELRVKRGLAYYVSTQIEANPDTGYLVTFTGIDHQKISEVVELILKEYKKIKEKIIDSREVARSKEYLKGRLRLSLEESEDTASFYALQELLEERILTPEEKIKEIEKVTPVQIQEVAKEIFKEDRLNIAVISPKEQEFKHFTF
jgi:predicted Zn-dependent peptidase